MPVIPARITGARDRRITVETSMGRASTRPSQNKTKQVRQFMPVVPPMPETEAGLLQLKPKPRQMHVILSENTAKTKLGTWLKQ
jgi:hypothetical protein